MFSLAFLPASISVALLRYRLLDFEIVWRRATAAAVAGGLILAGGYIGLFRNGAEPSWPTGYGPLVWLVSLAAAGLLYRPIRDRVARALEQRAYRGRYEERRTLAAFAAELAAETDLDRTVAAVTGRLGRTLDVERIAVLVPVAGSDRAGSEFRLLHGEGLGDVTRTEPFDFGDIAKRAPDVASCVVISDPQVGDLSAPAAALGCLHFVPCRLRGRTLAWIGLGPTRADSLLSSDDLALVEMLAGPLAIVLENARLYASLEAKANQYQLLKDYNENIVESLSVGILVLDMEGRVRSWNTYLELTLRIARDQAVGRHLRELLPPALLGRYAACQDETGNGNVYKFRLRAVDFPEEFRPDNAEAVGERFVNIAVAPLIARDFEQIGRLVILDDVTDRIELEEQVVQADKLSSVGLLAAGIAHEVNTPLAVISSYSQMLASRFAGGSDEASLLGKMTEQTFRASEIVNSLLDFSRTSSVTLSPCDMNAVIRNTLDLVEPQLRQAGISVEHDPCVGAAVLGNQGKLQQVFLNLFLNARDAMPSGGTLQVRCVTRIDANGFSWVEVLVSDTGTGIEPSVQRQIFDPFYTTKGPRKGTGLGLAVSYGIVQEHSGSISVESVPGQGTAFSLTFPLAQQSVHA